MPSYIATEEAALEFSTRYLPRSSPDKQKQFLIDLQCVISIAVKESSGVFMERPLDFSRCKGRKIIGR